jgi:hypothetical protein
MNIAAYKFGNHPKIVYLLAGGQGDERTSGLAGFVRRSRASS